MNEMNRRRRGKGGRNRAKEREAHQRTEGVVWYLFIEIFTVQFSFEKGTFMNPCTEKFMLLGLLFMGLISIPPTQTCVGTLFKFEGGEGNLI